MLKKILHSSILTALIRGSSFGVRTIALLIAAHFAAPTVFGVIAIFFTIAEIARLVADFGVDTYTMRGYASSRDKSKLSEVARAASSAKLLFGSLTAVISAFVMHESRPDAKALILPFALMVFSPLVMNLPVNYFIAKMRGKYIALFVATCGLLSLVVFGSCYVWTSGHAISFLVIPTAEIFVGLVLMTRVPFMRRSVIQLDIDAMWKLLKLTAPIGAATVLGIAYGRMDVFFLEKFRSAQEVGLYSFAVRMVEPFQFIAGALAVNAYSHISASAQFSTADGMKTSSRYRKVMLLYAMAAFTVVLLIAFFLVGVLFQAYRDTTTLLLMAALVLTVRCGNLITTSTIQAFGKFKFITMVALWNFVFLTIAMLLLVPKFGTYGAVLAVLLMEALNFGMQNVYLTNLYEKFERA